MRLLFLTLLIVATIPSSAQYSNPIGKIISKEKLHEDIEVLKGSLEATHPGLYMYRSKHQIDSIFNELILSILKPQSQLEFYQKVLPTLSFIGCGHTYADLPKDIDKIIMEGKHFFPLDVRIINEKLICTSVNTSENSGIKPGNEIISINGVSSKILKQKGVDAYWQDGLGITGKVYKLEKYFSYFYAYLVERPKSFSVVFNDIANNKKEITINALTLDEIKSYKTSERSNNNRNLSLEFLQNSSIGLLTIKQFFDWNEDGVHFSYTKELQRIFEELNTVKPRHLIIDIRDNGGGMQPWRVSAYLTDSAITYANQAQYIYDKKNRFSSYQELNKNMKWIRNRSLNSIMPGSNKTKKLNDSTFILTNLFVTNEFKPLSPNYEGKVYTLLNGGSFSAASWFASIVKSHGLSSIIGQETAGGYFGQTSMSPVVVTLPHSELTVNIPLVKFTHNVDSSKNRLNRGIIPDYPIKYNTEDFVKEKDLELEKALELINKSN